MSAASSYIADSTPNIYGLSLLIQWTAFLRVTGSLHSCSRQHSQHMRAVSTLVDSSMAEGHVHNHCARVGGWLGEYVCDHTVMLPGHAVCALDWWVGAPGCWLPARTAACMSLRQVVGHWTRPAKSFLATDCSLLLMKLTQILSER